MTMMPLGDNPFGFNMPDPNLDTPQAKPKTGMFGGGKFGLGEAIVAALNGYLAGTGNPAGVANIQMIAAKRRQQQEAQEAEQQYQRQRGDGMQDWIAKEQFKIANPGAANNDTVADYNFWKQTLPPEQFNQWLESKINPPQLMNVPGVGIVQVPRMGGGQAPKAPVGKLTPIDDGGQMPQASGNFPY